MAGLDFVDLACCQYRVWRFFAALPQNLWVWAVCRGHDLRRNRIRPVCPEAV